MGIELWTFVIIVVGSIIYSIWQGTRKSKGEASSSTTDAEDEEPESWIQDAEEACEPNTSTKAAQEGESTVTPIGKEEEIQLEEEQADVEIDLTDEDEAKKAFIASEIFNKKY